MTNSRYRLSIPFHAGDWQLGVPGVLYAVASEQWARYRSISRTQRSPPSRAVPSGSAGSQPIFDASMRILVVSNFYPPHYIGGYELGCRDVVEALKSRGHQIKVLTSTHGVPEARVEGDVYRWLRTGGEEPRPKGRVGIAARLLQKEWTNQNSFRALVEAFDPELVYVWNPVGISLSLARVAEEMRLPLCYLVSDRWLAQAPAEDLWLNFTGQPPRGIKRFRGMVFRSIGRVLRLSFGQVPYSNVQFTSRHLMEQAIGSGKTIGNAMVIHWGIDTTQFSCKPIVTDEASRLLYVGQVMPHKGVHTAIEALKVLRDEYQAASVTLDIVGGSTDPDYVERLHGTVREYGLEKAVRFRGSVAREDLPRIYHEYDVLIFPSAWDEPFSITLLEAMSSDLPVVGTATGGSGEILEDGVNALVFPKESPRECAAHIARLLHDPALLQRLRLAGRSTVEQRFGFQTMVDAIEASIYAAVRN
jgi:glycogen(starch) synthase